MLLLHVTSLLTKPYRKICDGAIDRWILDPKKRGISDKNEIYDRQVKMMQSAQRIAIALAATPLLFYAAAIGGLPYVALAGLAIAPISVPSAFCALGGFCTSQAFLHLISAIFTVSMQPLIPCLLFFSAGWTLMEYHDVHALGLLEPMILNLATRFAKPYACID
jgi:hypothetical protein